MGPFEFDPIAIEIGPLAIRWYALSYVFGLVLAWRYALRISRLAPNLVSARQLDDFLVWAILGVVLGARLGIVLFYRPGYYLSHPAEILQIWRGGMSFHGGFVAVVLAMIIYARRHAIPLLALTDLVGAAAPIGLFLGRVANFINGELWGRTTEVPWGVIFKDGGPLPRHPSQLYEAALEGLVLFSVLAVLIHGRWQPLRRPGLITGIFIGGYGAARIFVEFFRQPDNYIGAEGFLALGTTWGQWLTLPLLAGGIYLVWRAHKHPRESGS
jgi:phosphatidylglycerol:prolipoprotein diacylglycerol transferase